MAKTEIYEFDETNANNTDIAGIPVVGSVTTINQVDDIVRGVMGALARWSGDDTVASGGTTDLGAVPGQYVTVSGTTTITALGTVKAGTVKLVKFSGALTLTHNSTSLILPGAANITTAAGDAAEFVSEGSGNWRCLGYQRAATIPAIVTPWVAYTPVFVGMASPPQLKAYSRRNGPDLETIALWQNGTVSGSTFTMTIGYAGASGGVAISSDWNSVRFLAGSAIWDATDYSLCVLAAGGESVIRLGVSGPGNNSFAPALGSALAANTVISARFSVPIQGW